MKQQLTENKEEIIETIISAAKVHLSEINEGTDEFPIGRVQSAIEKAIDISDDSGKIEFDLSYKLKVEVTDSMVKTYIECGDLKLKVLGKEVSVPNIHNFNQMEADFEPGENN